MPHDTKRDPRYDVLFEPVDIGPVTAKNRFYQVPHCNGMGYRDPTALAWMRGVKAQGGWAVVCTEQVESPPHLGHHALHRAPPLGRPRHPDARAHGGSDPRVRGARGESSSPTTG